MTELGKIRFSSDQHGFEKSPGRLLFFPMVYTTFSRVFPRDHLFGKCLSSGQLQRHLWDGDEGQATVKYA